MQNNIENTVGGSQSPELSAIQEDFDELSSVFGDLGLDTAGADGDESSPELEELNKAVEGTEFDSESELYSSPTSGLSALDAVDSALANDFGSDNFGWPGNYLKNKAKKMIDALKRIIYRNRRYYGCARPLTRAVRAFGSRKYLSAIRHAYSTYRCIKSKR